MRQLLNECFITINKKPNRLRKPAIQQNEEDERESVCQLHTLSKLSQLGGKASDFLMQSEDVWEVAGVSFVDKLFCPGMEPIYRI